jgi:hypothetical protein
MVSSQPFSTHLFSSVGSDMLAMAFLNGHFASLNYQLGGVNFAGQKSKGIGKYRLLFLVSPSCLCVNRGGSSVVTSL